VPGEASTVDQHVEWSRFCDDGLHRLDILNIQFQSLGMKTLGPNGFDRVGEFIGRARRKRDQGAGLRQRHGRTQSDTGRSTNDKRCLTV